MNQILKAPKKQLLCLKISVKMSNFWSFFVWQRGPLKFKAWIFESKPYTTDPNRSALGRLSESLY